ncbi:MAG: FtsX-like permease family protein, partial [Vicinamibacterales bacterium]
LVLLLACTNLTGLLLVRATDRQRERAICVALGAARLHLIRQSLAESALLSIIATAAAVTLTWWLAGVTAAWRPPIDFPLTARIVVDHRVLVLSIALAVLVTVLVGLAPALHGLRRDVVPVLKDQTTGVGPGWHFRDIVVAAQMALSAVLLIGALLVVRSLHQATQVDVGFNPRNAVAVRVDLALQGYDDERGRQLQRRVVERLSTLPGIESAGVANSLPLSLDQSSNGIYVEHRAEPRGSAVPFALYYQVSAGFFRTLETPLIEGRDFNSGDRRGSPPVAIVNQAFAHQLVGSGVIGRRFRTGRSGSWTEIVGVVRTGKYQSLGEAPKPVVFYPIAQSYNPTTTVLARTSMAAPQALDLVRRVVHDIDPALSLYGEGTLTDVLALPLLPLRIAATALAVFGILAVVLVTGGTYALVSYSVARRTREICIRLAVGAAASHIARLVLARTAALWLVGAAAGVLLMFLAGSLLSPVLLGVSPRDPAAFMAAAALLALVTCAACLLPLRRALASDPAALLRD